MTDVSDHRPWTVAELASVPRAIAELARARWMLRTVDGAAIAALNAESQCAEEGAIVPRVARAIPAAAGIVPWRADCLVQALAARNWLAGKGIRGTIVLGVDRDVSGIEPHAWLRVGETVVTGGRIDRYTVLLDGGEQGDLGS